jgi:hypothetical protein
VEYLDDVLVLSGAGVGGGSHVYANTLYVPTKQFFDAPEWASITDLGRRAVAPSRPGDTDLVRQVQHRLRPQRQEQADDDHGSWFDIMTGVVVNGPAAEPLKVYEVQEVEGTIQVRA